MANQVHSNPAYDDFDAKGLRALDVAIARGDEKVDLRELVRIGMISEETRARIEKQLPDHEALFGAALKREVAGGVDRPTAFKRAFSVYRRFQMEDRGREVVAADEDVIKKVSGHLKLPILAGENLSKNRPALAAALMRLRRREAADGFRLSGGAAFMALNEPLKRAEEDEAASDPNRIRTLLPSVPVLRADNDDVEAAGPEATSVAAEVVEGEAADRFILGGGGWGPLGRALKKAAEDKNVAAERKSAADVAFGEAERNSAFLSDFDQRGSSADTFKRLEGAFTKHPWAANIIQKTVGPTWFPAGKDVRHGSELAGKIDEKYTVIDRISEGDKLPEPFIDGVEQFDRYFSAMNEHLVDELKALNLDGVDFSFFNDFDVNLRDFNSGLANKGFSDLADFSPVLEGFFKNIASLAWKAKSKSPRFLDFTKKIIAFVKLVRKHNRAGKKVVNPLNAQRKKQHKLLVDRGEWIAGFNKLNENFANFASGSGMTAEQLDVIPEAEAIILGFNGKYQNFLAAVPDAEHATLTNLGEMVKEYDADMARLSEVVNKYFGDARSKKNLADAEMARADKVLADLNSVDTKMYSGSSKIHMAANGVDVSGRTVALDLLDKAFAPHPKVGDMTEKRRRMTETEDAVKDAQNVYTYSKDGKNFATLVDASKSYRQAVADCGLPSGTDYLKAFRKANLELDTAKNAKTNLDRKPPNEGDVIAKFKAEVGSVEPDLGTVDAREVMLTSDYNRDRGRVDSEIAQIRADKDKLRRPMQKDAVDLLKAQNGGKDPDPQVVDLKLKELLQQYQDEMESFDREILAKRQFKQSIRFRTRAEVVTLIKTEMMNAALAPSAVAAELEKLKKAYKTDVAEADDNIEKAQAAVEKLKTVFAKAGVLQKSLGPFLENIQAAQNVEIPLNDIFGADVVSAILDPDSMRIAMDSASGDQGSSAFDPERVQAYALEIANFIDGEVEFEGVKMKKTEALKRAFDKKIEERESERDAAKKAYEDAKLLADGSKDLSDTEAARRIIRAMVDEEYPELDDDEKKSRVEMILAEDVELARTDKGYRELAERGSEALLNTVSNSALKNMLAMKYTVQGVEKPFEPLKIFSPEDFESNQKIDALFGRGGAAGKVTLKNGFFALAALKRSGAEGTDFLQAVYFARKLREMLAEELGATEAMAEVAVQKKVTEVFKTQLEAADYVVQSYTTHQMSNQDEVDKNRTREFNLRYKVLKEKRRTGDLDHYNYKRQLSLLVKEVREAGLENKVDFSCDTAFAEFWNSKQAQWVRDLSKNVGKFGGKAVLGVAGGVLDVAGGMALGGAKLALETTGRFGWGVATSAVRNIFRPIIGFRNLFFKNKWTPIPSITEGVKEGFSNVFGYLGRKRAETWEAAKAKTATAWKERVGEVKFERKHYKDSKKDIAPWEAEIAEVAKAGVMPAFELGGDPVMDLTKFKAEIEKLVKAAAPKIQASNDDVAKSDVPKAS